MAKVAKGGVSKVVVWIILVLLIVGLGGFGVSNFGGNITAIGKVGDREIDVQRYFRELQNQIQSFSAQTGTNLTFAQAQSLGLDRAVLRRLISTVAIEDEAALIGLSAGDQEVKTQILAISAFQGIDGTFDREAYRFTLEQAGQSEQEFEESLRTEVARSIVQGAVTGGVIAPDALTDTLLNYIGERRSFSYAVLGADALSDEIIAPTDADLRGYFDANEADFMLPETRAITYVWLVPDMLVDTVEPDDAALRALYQERIDEFVTPERRLVERLILGEDAEDARARLDAGEVSFEDLVAERDLSLAEIDLGDIAEDDLDDGGAEVFAIDAPGIIGPIDTELGAALFRVNAILSGQETAFEEARAGLADELALDLARRVIGDLVETVDDLLAGGATLEELADETELRFGQIDWTDGATDGIAAYNGFREAATLAAKGEFPQVTQLGDGGIFALRVDDITEPRLQDFEAARERAQTGWRAEATAAALADQALALAERLRTGEDAQALGVSWQEESDLTRERIVPDTPADFMTSVFEMTTGEVRVIAGDTAAYLVRLDSAAPPDAEDAGTVTRRERLAAITAQSLGADILQAYTSAIEARAGISLNQAAINAVHANFR